MNILPFIPAGWLTYIGIAIKILSAVLALLTAIQGGDLHTIIQNLTGVLGVYATGDGVTSLGIRRAIARTVPVEAELAVIVEKPAGPSAATS